MKKGIYRVGVVEREVTISSGRLARKAPRQLIVLGTWWCGIVNKSSFLEYEIMMQW